MADFRRWITALAVLALFAELASAQVGGGGGSQTPLVCTVNSGVTPQLRNEGFTELVGDIVINCTGGTSTAAGAPIPQVNIVLNMSAPVTSRILPGNATNATEALLLIDEPGSGLPAPVAGFGPGAAQMLCSTPATGCAEFAQTAAVGSSTIAVATNSATVPSTGIAAGFNEFQALLTGPQQLTFFGVPILPPGSNGFSRVLRITNVRVYPNVATGSVTASISTNASNSLPLTNPVITVGFVQASLTTSVSKASTFGQCNSIKLSGFSSSNPDTGVLTFTEQFGTAFKTRVAIPGVTSAGNALVTPFTYGPASYNSTVGQNVPGSIYNAESGFIAPNVTGTNGAIAGLADFGTRLKAVFHNIPAGATVYVSVSNIQANGNALSSIPPTVAATPYAELVTGETAPDSQAFPTFGGSFVNVVGSGTSTVTTSGAIKVFPLTADSSGNATAVWEVLNSTNALDSLSFGVYTIFTANTASNSPAPGTTTVNLSYAPTPTAAFTASAAAAASSTLPIPRFADTSTAANSFIIAVCQTALLYPYATNVTGFETGIAVANTSTDPFGTAGQQGTCTFNLYGGSTTATGTGPAPAPFTSPSVATGTVYATTLTGMGASGFTGYVIAVCNFQYAHGYAAVSDVGVRNFVTSYLALVLQTGGIGLRGFPAETWTH